MLKPYEAMAEVEEGVRELATDAENGEVHGRDRSTEQKAASSRAVVK